MPTASWVQLILGDFAPLQSEVDVAPLPSAAHRRKPDAAPRARFSLLFGSGVTVGEIAAMAPSEKHRTPEARAQLDTIMDQLATLLERSRQQSQSVLVPMGEEMTTATRRSSSPTSCMPSAPSATVSGHKRGCRQRVPRPHPAASNAGKRHDGPKLP